MIRPAKAFAILGATASGKTRLALALAEQFPCEIISLDSALIYRDMNIGTAKPSRDELAAVPHHLIDIVTPLQSYSAAEFLSDCLRLVDEIAARGKIPLIVGGTMMYFHALTHGLNDLPEANPEIRQKLQQDKAKYGLSFLYKQLQDCDPTTAARLEPADSQRIERALEVFLLTNKPLSQHFAEQKSAPVLDLFTLTLQPENRAQLHTQIAQRFEIMLKNGFLDEMQFLRERYPDLHENLPSMRCVGYRQAWDFLENRVNHQDFVAQGIAATRQLAKRQITWLRKTHSNLILDPFSQTLDEQVKCTSRALQNFF
ncbi:tRNA dimethylallyltransferase [Alysiella crassa]|uniref:tRNA dimethylallyltransferase n=1 Tax=Alysiella crassa TaxID=153491 RepID=A0A376BUW4_9NEIS|nr:tRNA dimethylallyltransferase [Alysiella crassa]